MTAVEWLERQIVKYHIWKLNPVYDENCFDEIELSKAIIKAKELEKQQIIDFTNSFINEHTFGNYDGDVQINKTVDDYYNETFKKK